MWNMEASGRTATYVVLVVAMVTVLGRWNRSLKLEVSLGICLRRAEGMVDSSIEVVVML